MWADDAFVYHVYALAACGAPQVNDGTSAPVPRLDVITRRLDDLAGLGVTALLVGPLFESTRHGYDTVDYFRVDRRLGDDATLVELSSQASRRGIRLVLDAVLNHVGRDFWAFRDVIEHGTASRYASWFHLDPAGSSPLGDAFGYEGWAGNYELVKLDVDRPEVREHLFAAVTHWITTFDVAGLRLDAADVLSEDFLDALAAHARSIRKDVWLVGEIVHGEYNEMTAPGRLDAATNYELYKSLWSAHLDRNYHEVAYALNRQYGPKGIYVGRAHLTFADNHDVDRVASSVADPAHLYPLYGLIFTTPGVPSVYYGSEWGVQARRSSTSDHALRPAIDDLDPERPELADAIRRLARLRADHPVLRHGSYEQLHVAAEQLVFARRDGVADLVVAVNASHEAVQVPIRALAQAVVLQDVLNGEEVTLKRGRVSVPPTWLRVLRPAASGRGGRAPGSES